MPIVTHLNYTTDLDRGVSMQALKNAFLTGDQEAHRITVACYRSNSREDVDLTGAGVHGYFIRADGSTVVIDGAAESNKASITLPASCYVKPGRFSLVIKASLGDVIHTILWVEGAISPSHTNTIIDPGEVVPTLDELLAQIAEMEQATEATQAATSSAMEASKTALDAALAAANAAADLDSKVQQAHDETFAAAVRTDIDQGLTAGQQAQGRANIGAIDAAEMIAAALTRAPAIPEEASGALVSTTYAAAQPAAQLVSHIAPVQAGEGDPYPGGSGKNKFSGWIVGSGLDDYGAIISDETAARTDYIPVSADTAYYISGLTGSLQSGAAYYDADKGLIAKALFSGSGEITKQAITTPDGCAYVILCCYESSSLGGSIAELQDNVQLELGTSATAYEAYANIRPISGWDSVKVVRTGKNMLSIGAPRTVNTNGLEVTYRADGGIAVVGTATADCYVTGAARAEYPAGKYILAGCPAGGGALTYMLYAALSTGYAYDMGAGVVLEIADTVLINIKVMAGVTMDHVFYPKLMRADTADTAFEPYQGQTLTAELPETVYSGSMDWTTGVLTVEWGSYTVSGSENWLENEEIPTSGNVPRFETTLSQAPLATVAGNEVCTHYPCNGANVRGAWCTSNNIDGLGVRIAWEYDSVDELIAYLQAQYAAGTPVQVVYELATPYTIQLTPQQLDMLKGTNNLWSDAGDTSLVYVADTKMYVDGKFAELEAAILSMSSNV